MITETKRSVVTPDQWEWFGTSGHFICGEWCRFHLCTKVGRFLVSTVGAYVPLHRSGGSEISEAKWLSKNWPGERIGCDRFYETMVFEAGERCQDPRCDCGMPTIITDDLDFLGYNSPRDATNGHMQLRKKWAELQDWREQESDDASED